MLKKTGVLYPFTTVELAMNNVRFGRAEVKARRC